MEYAMLLAPGQSRVYYEQAQEMFREELRLTLTPFQIGEVRRERLGGREYLCFSAPGLSEQALRQAARTSGFYALFSREGALLRPLEADPDRAFPDRLPAMLKYSGKTNEQFTRLLVNLCRSACTAGGARQVLLDPLCGRGTTLFEAMTLGLDAVGVEQNAAACREGETFLLRFLKEERYKHDTARSRPRDASGRQAECLSVTAARDKSAWREGNTQSVRFFHGDALRLDGLIARESVHLLVTDLPYGVQHGSHQAGEKSRGAAELVRRALPVWKMLLRPGAACVLAFNEYTTPWKDLAGAAEEHGLRVLSEEETWRHRVAEAIRRNVIILRKEGRA